ncbi:helix-turn-helix domain-containing protein [Serratia symbiotica]|uniref:helix-turn-helix domain-containing protein n=1 Tax=Serratia symbiotica TaxID=138074 RepID=UPI001F3696B4|nr:helix-turn-helix domain-containing protein [Serratia symbiotica]
MSPVAIELYGYVAEHCDWRNGRYVATSAEVANALSVTVRSVQRANNELEAAELIRFKRGIYAVNPEFNWGGRSWNISKSCYYSMGKKIAQVIDFAEATQAMSKLATKGVRRETLREVSARIHKEN